MSTEFARHFTLILPQRRFIQLLIFVECGPTMTFRMAFNENARWIVTKNSFRALDQVNSIVRTRRADVMLQHDRSPFGCFNDAGVVVACLVNLFPLGISCRD